MDTSQLTYPLPWLIFCYHHKPLCAKTDLVLHKLFRVLPFLGQNIFAFLSSVDPKFPCDPVKLVLPYLVVFALDLYPLITSAIYLCISNLSHTISPMVNRRSLLPLLLYSDLTVSVYPCSDIALLSIIALVSGLCNFTYRYIFYSTASCMSS